MLPQGLRTITISLFHLAGITRYFALQRITRPQLRSRLFRVRRKSQTTFPIPCPGGPLTTGNEQDAAKQTADGLLLYRPVPGNLAIPDQ